MQKSEKYSLAAVLVWDTVWGVVGMVGVEWAWWIVGVGGIVFLVLLYRTVTTKAQRFHTDESARIALRKQYLPQLKDTLDNMIIRKQELANMAARKPLKWYKKHYLQLDFIEKMTSRFKSKKINENNNTILRLIRNGFLYHNLYYLSLKDCDDSYSKLLTEYNKYYSYNQDKKLNNLADNVLKIADKAYSAEIIVGLTKKYTVQHSQLERLLASKEKTTAEISKQLSRFNERYDLLINEGVPDE